MAKKKSKKNNQKQVEAAAPPDSSVPTVVPMVVPMTEEPPASEAAPEAQEQSPATLSQPTSDEHGSTSAPERTPGDIQDTPGEVEASTVADANSGEMASISPGEPDHVEIASGTLQEEFAKPTPELQETTPSKDGDTHTMAPDPPPLDDVVEAPPIAPKDTAVEATSAEEATEHAQPNTVRNDLAQFDFGTGSVPPEESSQEEAQTSDAPEPPASAQLEDTPPAADEAPIAVGSRAEISEVEVLLTTEPTTAEPEQSDG